MFSTIEMGSTWSRTAGADQGPAGRGPLLETRDTIALAMATVMLLGPLAVRASRHGMRPTGRPLIQYSRYP